MENIPNRVGAPPKFNDVEKFQQYVNEYFESCFEPIVFKGEVLVNPQTGEVIKRQFKQWTVAGLCHHLGCCRDTLLEYEKNNPKFSEFSDTITRAKSLIHVGWNEALFTKDGYKGAIFSLLNNFADYHNKNESTISTKDDGEIKGFEIEIPVAPVMPPNSVG